MPDERLRLEEELRELGRDLDARVATSDLSGAVVGRIERGGHDRQRAQPRHHHRRRVAVVAVLVAAGAAATPPAVATIADWFRVGGEEIHREPPPRSRATVSSLPPGAPLPELGERSTLAEVRRRMAVVVPHVAGYGAPDEVWFAATPRPRVSLVYDAAGRERLLIQEFAADGSTAVRKYLTSGTRDRAVTVGPYTGVFLDGADHTVWYETADGGQVVEVGRLVGNALIFQRRELTIRLEGDLPRDRMVAIASSLR
jgi:hypothetical protein